MIIQERGDTPEMVDACLSCRAKVCKYGECDVIRKMDKDKRKRHGQYKGRMPKFVFRWRGRTWTLPELAKESGLSRDTMYKRLVLKKWPVEEAVTTPRLRRERHEVPDHQGRGKALEKPRAQRSKRRKPADE